MTLVFLVILIILVPESVYLPLLKAKPFRTVQTSPSFLYSQPSFIALPPLQSPNDHLSLHQYAEWHCRLAAGG